MGGPGSGKPKKTEDTRLETHQFLREAVRIAERNAPKAMQVLVERMERGEVVAAREILDRGLGKPTQKVESQQLTVSVQFTAEQYAELRRGEDHELKLLNAVEAT